MADSTAQEPPAPQPITIRLLHDYTAQPPTSDASAPQDQGSQHGDPGDDAQKPKGPKDDSFYRAWDKFTSKSKKNKTPTKTSQLPSLASPPPDVDVQGPLGSNLEKNSEGIAGKESVAASFEDARDACKAKVRAIVKECERLNKKYFDRVFNLGDFDTLESLWGLSMDRRPGSTQDVGGLAAVKRVEDIFNKPRFIIDGATAGDIKQSSYLGDCWFLSGLTALSGSQDLLTKLCVERNEEVGVYGFVFFRDGEWISVVIDDRLALKSNVDDRRYLLKVFGDKIAEETEWKNMVLEALPKKFLEDSLKGSDALYYSSCKDSEETWLPLIEKAYAKAHGDYQSIEGGFSGEAIEDLTGGVNTSIDPEDVLCKDRLWAEMMQVNKTFLFGCGSREAAEAVSGTDEEGLVRNHDYTVLEAREVKRETPSKKDKKGNEKKECEHATKDEEEKPLRLLKIRNPWGSQEWQGAWSDGSKEWTPYMMKELDHTFGDDGIFWISFEDFLKYYSVIDRTRLFGPEWTMIQQWAALRMERSVNFFDTDYHSTRFQLEVPKPGPVVIVLAKPDYRYFDGFAGRYSFGMHFRLYEDGEDQYLARSMQRSSSGRSCSVEIDLEPGRYTIHIKLMPWRTNDCKTPGEVIEKLVAMDRREKLMSVGQSFDMVHSKGRLREAEASARKDMRKNEWQKSTSKLKHDRYSRQVERMRSRRRAWRIKAEMKRKKEAKAAAKKTSGEDSKPSTDVAATEQRQTPMTPISIDAGDEGSTQAGAEKVAGNSEASNVPMEGEAPALPSVEQSTVESKNESTQTGDEPQVPHKEAPPPDIADEDEDGISDVCDEDFDWSSDIDGPAFDEQELSDEGDDNDSEDPWNATAVVNMRVYSTNPDLKLGIQSSDGDERLSL